MREARHVALPPDPSVDTPAPLPIPRGSGVGDRGAPSVEARLAYQCGLVPAGGLDGGAVVGPTPLVARTRPRRRQARAMVRPEP